MRLLPAVFGDVLNKIALVVNEAKSHQRQTEVGCFFQVIAGEDAETAGVNRQRLMQPELEREVSDGFVFDLGIMGSEPGVLLLHVGIHAGEGAVEMIEVGGKAGGVVEAVALHFS